MQLLHIRGEEYTIQRFSLLFKPLTLRVPILISSASIQMLKVGQF